MNDMHVHTRFSKDSKVLMADYVDYARKIGVDILCFTDHVSNNLNDNGAGYYDSIGFFSEFNRLRAETRGLKLLSGIEFDCPHRFHDEFNKFLPLPYDCIIGGVHYCDLSPDLYISSLRRTGVTAEECFNAYWKELVKCVSHGGFDVLGHMDVPKRYYKTLIYDEKLIFEIFRIMLANGIIPEINTSSYREGLTVTLPDRDLLEIYKSAGGKYVTIGSDAHTLNQLASGCDSAGELMRSLNLLEVVFINRKMVIV